MPALNIAESTFTYDAEDPEGFRSGMHRLGPVVGAKDSGTSVYELPPGQALCPYHYEYGEEEWVLVLEGAPTLRTPDGIEPLTVHDLAFFPKGPQGAHQLRNDTTQMVRVLMWSTVVHPSATAYPDSDKIGIWTGNRDEDVMVERSSAVEYFHGETGE
jgi:uncharacterized cupin superfamily protein